MGIINKIWFKAATILLLCLVFLFIRREFDYNKTVSAVLPSYFKAQSAMPDILGIILAADISLNQIEYETKKDFIPTFDNIDKIKSMEDVRAYLFNIDKAAYVTEEDLNISELSKVSLTTDLTGNEPKVLIFHTHSQEDFSDSMPGVAEETIVGVGSYLAEILADEYGVSVVHDTGSYDMKDGKLIRGLSYENMEPAIQKILDKYPSIEIVIDLHRDGVPDNIHLVTEINGKQTAKIMFFNGIARYNNNGTPTFMEELSNPYVKENLALSLQLYLNANERYPGFARKTYIKPYRYSLHLKPKSMLVEVGANTNTIEEAMNAMEPLSEIIMSTLGM